MPLPREEYVEQAYFFRTIRERMQQSMSTQELLEAVKQEVLSTTQLPYALDFMASELRLTGGFATAMAKLPHYFTPFQTFVVAEGEKPEGKFDFRVGMEILQREAEYRTQSPTPQGLFLFQFETLCRNRLGYDRGLEAIAGDEIYDENWREWILTVRRQIGLIDLGDMLYVRSEHYRQTRGESGEAGPLRGKRGPHRPGQPAEGPALPLCRAGPAPGLSDRSPCQARGQQPHAHSHLATQDRTAGKPHETPRGRDPRGHQFVAILQPGQPSREAVGTRKHDGVYARACIVREQRPVPTRL